jgi:hypothetical protein
MSNEQIKTLLEKLRDELQTTDIDSETRGMLQELDANLHGFLDPESKQDDSQPVLEKAAERTRNTIRHQPPCRRTRRARNHRDAGQDGCLNGDSSSMPSATYAGPFMIMTTMQPIATVTTAANDVRHNAIENMSTAPVVLAIS